MTTQFVTLKVELQAKPANLLTQIETELQKQGEPLRWAVTHVDAEQQIATVEAVIILTSESVVLA